MHISVAIIIQNKFTFIRLLQVRQSIPYPRSGGKSSGSTLKISSIHLTFT